MLKDFGELVRVACESGTTDVLLDRWNADPNIRLEYSPAVVTVDACAFSSEIGESLTGIAQLAKRRNREVPFTCLFDERNRRVTQVLRGVVGRYGVCDWEAGQLLHTSRASAQARQCTYALGHTHPARYGAVCSDVYHDDDDLLRLGDPPSLWVLQRGLQDVYGGDYCEMFARQQLDPRVSRYAWILSPKENQAGVFEVLSAGRVRYHPWRVVQ